MTEQQIAWSALNEAIGEYTGRGINHEKQNYSSRLRLAADFQDKTLVLNSSAVGDNGENFHSEKSVLGFDIHGDLAMWVSSTNHPGVTPHFFDRIEIEDGGVKIVFRYGNVEDEATFREEVYLTVNKNKTIDHFYAWGLPDGDFQVRSGSSLRRDSLVQIDGTL